jgi:hypothetical protein
VASGAGLVFPDNRNATGYRKYICYNGEVLCVTFRIICRVFENYLSSLACVRKPDKGQKFLYLDFILSFLPKIWCSGAMIQLSLRTGKNTEVSFTIPNAGIDHRDK